jgi:hypothetical protein
VITTFIHTIQVDCGIDIKKYVIPNRKKYQRKRIHYVNILDGVIFFRL